jgi:amino acid adenylation domain-containing protein
MGAIPPAYKSADALPRPLLRRMSRVRRSPIVPRVQEVLHDLLDAAADAAADRPAVRHRGDALTYRELQEVSRRLTGWLAELGVQRGNRVVVALPVDTLLPPLLFACSRLGAPFVVLRSELPAVALAHVLDDCEPALLLTDREHGRALAAARGIALRGLDEVRVAAVSASPPAPPPPLGVDPVCLIYTSGSTGLPRAVVSLHSNVVFAARAIQSQLEYERADVVYCALPLAFDYGLYQIFLSTLAGAELYLATADGTGPALLAELAKAGATVLPAVPPLAANLAKLLSRRATVRPPLRLLTNTGAAMPPSVLAELRAQLPELRVQLMFGLTECKRAAIMPKDEDSRRPGACGRALPGTEILVVDDEGRRLPPGELGEVVVRGPHVMAGYWRQPERTAERFPRAEGLFPELRTGDYGSVDGDGYLYFAGRRDDLYKERGFRVSAAEVEAAAHRVPGVEAVAVLPPGARDDGATLLVAGKLSPDRVLRLLHEQLEDVKVPARCVVVPRVPVTPNGKVDRRELAVLAQSGNG